MVYVLLSLPFHYLNYRTQRRIQDTVQYLATLKLGQSHSGLTEDLIRHGFRIERKPSSSSAGPRQFEFHISDLSPEDDAPWHQRLSIIPYATQTMNLLGYTRWNFYAVVEADEVRVQKIYFGVGVASVMYVGAGAMQTERPHTLLADISPDYSLQYGKGSRILIARFTTAISEQQYQRLFDIHLACIHYPLGCHSASQIAPAMGADFESQTKAWKQLQKQESCPAPVLDTRGRDFPDITLVRLEGIEPVLGQQPTHELQLQFARVRVLRFRSYNGWRMMPEHSSATIGDDTAARLGVNQAAIGKEFIYFLWGEHIFGPCDFVPATKENVSAVEQAIDKYSPLWDKN